MDVLSDILQTCRLRSSVFACTELGAPWGMSTQGRPESIFHVIMRGTAWLDADGLPATRLDPGDVVMVAPHRRHALRDAPKTRARPIEQLLGEGYFAPGRPPPPPDRPATQLVCGCFHVEEVAARTLLAVLPPVIHLRDLSRVAPWLEHTIKLMSYESCGDRPGSETVVNRLCDALFVYVVRDFIESSTGSHRASWLRGLSDPHIASSLRLIHERPAEDWTVATLASEVGLSRSGFAARFTELVGESPMRYITRWRLHKALEMLRAGTSSIAEVASRVGYESAAAFHKAFKRTLGVSPGTLLRAEPAQLV